jgi:predicted ATPase
MVNKIEIKNFKSIVDLKLELGRVNILIGANGCGKTNILEAIAVASAANQNRLDDVNLGTRLRMPEPEFMFSGFEDNDNKMDISITEGSAKTRCELTYDQNKSKWINVNKTFDLPNLDTFLVFSPEESNLRKFSDETAIRPLGRRGEGMFRHLKELLTNGEKEKIINALNDGLYLLDWFKGFDMPKDLFVSEARLDISDRFLKDTKQMFDQRSTNEGFLYLLFYLILFNSEKTPSFFAIDNIETSFNPKLSRQLLQHLVEVAKKNNKQVIITTHSPYVLDGLDLSDDEQRLFVVRRNIDGHTKVSRIPYKEDEDSLLSEVWMSGVLGGLPDNF